MGCVSHDARRCHDAPPLAPMDRLRAWRGDPQGMALSLRAMRCNRSPRLLDCFSVALGSLPSRDQLGPLSTMREGAYFASLASQGDDLGQNQNTLQMHFGDCQVSDHRLSLSSLMFDMPSRPPSPLAVLGDKLEGLAGRLQQNSPARPGWPH